MSGQVAVDFGTTNTVVAIVEADTVRILHLPGLAREQPREQSPLVPAAVHLAETVRSWLFFQQRVPQVRIGQSALNQNYDNFAAQSRMLAQSFKPFLGAPAHRPVACLNGAELSAQEITSLFLRELLKAVRRQHIRITDPTIPTPVGYCEPYRAALGSGANVARKETLLHGLSDDHTAWARRTRSETV